MPPLMVQLSSVSVLAVHSARELVSSSVSGSKNSVVTTGGISRWYEVGAMLSAGAAAVVTVTSPEPVVAP